MDKALAEAIRRIVWKPRTTVGEIRREIAKLLPKPETTVIRTGEGDRTLNVLKKMRDEE